MLDHAKASSQLRSLADRTKPISLPNTLSSSVHAGHASVWHSRLAYAWRRLIDKTAHLLGPFPNVSSRKPT